MLNIAPKDYLFKNELLPMNFMRSKTMDKNAR